MGSEEKKPVGTLVVDTTAFIQNASLQNIAEKMVTCQDVVDEITNKRQLRRLVVLPFDLIIKDVFPENIQVVTEFSKQTGDYRSLSATDIKVMALTYQLEKEKFGTDHLRTEPILQRPVVTTEKIPEDINPDISGFYIPGQKKDEKNQTENQIDPSNVENTVNSNENVQTMNKVEQNKSTEESEIKMKELDKELLSKFEKLDVEISDELEEDNTEDILVPTTNESDTEEKQFDSACEDESSSESEENNFATNDEDDDDSGWITPSNVKIAKKQVNSQLMEEKHVAVACMTTDFAMQNVLKQMNLNVAALDGRVIKQIRTYILRCYACFKTTSKMDVRFCPKCGNDTLKKVAVSVDEKGEMHIHINPKKPLTGRGKKYSIPRIKGGKHPNNPILVSDQPMPDNKPSRLARTKINPLDDDYIAGFSPFATRDVNSRSAKLCIRPGQEVKNWMKKNPNENRRKRK